MRGSTKLGLVLLGAGAGGLAATYLILRRNRAKIDRAAQATREVADQADRVANTLEGVRRALGPAPEKHAEEPGVRG